MKILAGLILCASTLAAQPPPFSEWEYQGMYHLEGGGSCLSYVTGAASSGWINGNVNLCSHLWAPLMVPAAEPSLDRETAAAITVGDWVDPSYGRADDHSGYERNANIIGFAPPLGGPWTEHTAYNAPGTDWPGVGRGDAGPWRVVDFSGQPIHYQLASGYLGEIPPQYAALFSGATHFSGVAFHSIRQKGSYGPAFVALDLSQNPVPGGAWTGQVIEQLTLAEVSPPDDPDTPWKERSYEAQTIGGAFVWGDGWDAWVATGKVGTLIWYGHSPFCIDPPPGVTDTRSNNDKKYGRCLPGWEPSLFPGTDTSMVNPCGGNQRGRQTADPQPALWVYDAADLALVADGTLTPQDISWIEQVDVGLPQTQCKALGGVWFDEGRLYVLVKVDGQGDARYPEVHVWDLPSTEPPPPEPTTVTVTIDGTTTEHLCYTSATLASATESFSIDC